ncbi:hypothetical protein TCE0_024r07544 [Aspergillus terreus]|uniref:Uncharacterized protein n=1 Tax=Aspergillus terreus TaxID=33178 RepID=A0A5M3Z518_ASPTE|nr:hypothetical protein ATETN484_0009047000 [Aspergillus terreus]GFF17921.1 hypothetical protein TCE0_024r07544 [Aspergillus terreus]
MYLWDKIQEDHFEKPSLLYYKGKKADESWTDVQSIDLNNWFGDYDGWWDASRGAKGYAEQSKGEMVIPEPPGDPDDPHDELKLIANMKKKNKEYRGPQGIFLYEFFDMDNDGHLQRNQYFPTHP